MAGWLSRLLGGGPGKGLTVEDLAKRLGMTADELRAAPVAYKSFTIPKRSGGNRTIHAPEKSLKELQRRLLYRLLVRLKCHPSATGFERRYSIVTNALPHVGKSVVIHLDLRDFFPSTSERRVREYFQKIGWNNEASKLLTNLCTWKGGLPQGAPTSPRLSNLLNHGMDARLAGLARKLNASYSRYADDMTFSFDDPAAGSPTPKRNPRTGEAMEAKLRTGTAIIGSVKVIVADYGYELHQKRKLTIRRRHQQQRVTGLVVNDKVNLPRRTRRLLRAVAHHHRIGKPATLTPVQLAGWQSLKRMIEEQGTTQSPA